jgi:cyclic pyranopterin phosphate synthase
MALRSNLIRGLRPFLRRHPAVLKALKRVDERVSTLHHSAAARFASLIRPSPRQITIAITAQCNLLCQGCRYGRDFMVGAKLPFELVRGALDDARAAGANTARFFGGEPTLHEDLPRMIAHARQLGLDTYITTNGTLLKQRVRELHAAGLGWMTIGFYGVGARYDEYAQRPGLFRRLAEGLEALREHCGDAIQVQINFLLSRRSCNLDDLHAAWDFARRFGCFFNIDPISESIPFFADPREQALSLEETHREALAAVVERLLELKAAHPEHMPQSVLLLRALPDLLLRTKATRIPCDAYQMVWIGADGTVQLCDSWFELGNLLRTPLREILFSAAHRQACRDGFALACPNCHCKIDSRIRKDAASLRRYGDAWDASSLRATGSPR